ncbi:hypothetical protein [Streptomyces sp. YGL11-2]|uniref:hypothetical protein n=1 Tax=Streptomyces sp. YGL11-2 TaxID=3414028 RepID=UPI003CE9A55F
MASAPTSPGASSLSAGPTDPANTRDTACEGYRRHLKAHREAAPPRRVDPAIAEAVERQTKAMRELSRRAFPEPEPDGRPTPVEQPRAQRHRGAAVTHAQAVCRARAEVLPGRGRPQTERSAQLRVHHGWGVRREQSRKATWLVNSTGGTMSWQDGMGEFVRADKRRIQTAVWGSADSEEPLMLPMEAIELDAFRHRYGSDTFWCGTLLGGCGGRLTTKLYTDRACHFAHHPDPDGLPHVCGRRARGVNSADHLYVKSAAVAWLADRGEQASFAYTRPDGAPLGFVVDVRWQHCALRVHLDQAVTPVWDNGIEPVLGMAVRVERGTLIRRWYVHRIRLDSEGTARRVRIGTEAFARPTAWFALDDCEMTERGLSTPAVERIIQGCTTAPPSRWPAAEIKRASGVMGRAQVLLRQLTDARKVESVVVVNRVCRDIAALTGVGPATQAELADAVQEAYRWLQGQADVWCELFARLDEAATARNTQHTRELLVRANATAAHERTEAEEWIVGAAGFLAARAQEEEAWDAERDVEVAAGKMAALTALAASQTVRRIFRDLRRLPRRYMSKATLHSQVQLLVDAAAEAGKRITPSQVQEIDRCKSRVGLGQPVASASTVPAQSRGNRTASSKQPANSEAGAAEQSAITVEVGVWKDHYGGLRAAAPQTRPEASVRYVPLPHDEARCSRG